MKIREIISHDDWMLAANITVAVVIFAGVYLMNMKGIGKGSQPMFAIPFALMVVGIYEVCFLMFEEVKSKTFKWVMLGCFAFLSTYCLIWVLQK